MVRGYVEVPGGQAMCISTHGAIYFTKPHTEGSENAVAGYLSYVNPTYSGGVGGFGVTINGTAAGWL